MKAVPTVRLADTTDAAALPDLPEEVRFVMTDDAAALPDLPEEVRFVMTDIAGAAREGLTAVSVAAGMAVTAAMFEAEIGEVCGPKGKHSKAAGPRCATGRDR